jgi:hypothetical protein
LPNATRRRRPDAVAPDPRLGAAGKKEKAARDHEVIAAVFRREAAALRAEVETEKMQRASA